MGPDANPLRLEYLGFRNVPSPDSSVGLITRNVAIWGLFPKCAVCHRGTQTSQAQSSICLVRVLGELWDGDRVVAVDCAGPVMSGPGRRCGDAVQCCRPCYNESAYIAETINSLRAQRFRGGWEIVVVDNTCTDDTAEIARGLGARVVVEERRGVCSARQRGAEAISGEIIVSADADTIYPPEWLATIDAAFRADKRVVAVAGPCRYTAGPFWGRVYGRLLFGSVDLIYRLTGRVWYVSATNLAFCRERWPGYDVRLTQGGDELDLLRKLRRSGVVRYEHANAVWTSSRRLTRGLLYNIVVTLVVYYLSAYLLNRVFGRPIVGSAPPCRKDTRRSPGRSRLAAGVVAVVLVLSPVADSAQVAATASHAVLEQLSVLLDPDQGR